MFGFFKKLLAIRSFFESQQSGLDGLLSFRRDAIVGNIELPGNRTQFAPDHGIPLQFGGSENQC